MNKLLVICPTYKRCNQFARMVASFYQTSTCADMIVLTQKGSTAKLINEVNYEGYDYVSVTNDDFIYHTHGWDQILIDKIESKKGYGIAFGNDGTNNKELPATAVISASIFRALGWIVYPLLTHLCGDMVWQYIGKKLNCLYYMPEVKIEHMHFLFGKAESLDYEYTNSKEMYKSDNAIFQHWLLHDSQEDIQKIRSRLGL